MSEMSPVPQSPTKLQLPPPYFTCCKICQRCYQETCWKCQDAQALETFKENIRQSKLFVNTKWWMKFFVRALFYLETAPNRARMGMIPSALVAAWALMYIVLHEKKYKNPQEQFVVALIAFVCGSTFGGIFGAGICAGFPIVFPSCLATWVFCALFNRHHNPF